MRLTTSPPSRAECHEIWEPKPPGTLWATQGLLRDSFTLLILISELDGGKWLIYGPGRSIHRGRACNTHYRRLGVPQDRSEHSGEERSLFPLPAVEHQALCARIMQNDPTGTNGHLY